MDVDTPKLSRKRRAQTRTEEFFGGKAAVKYAHDVTFHYRRIYFESLDLIINAIEDRFDQEDFRTYFKLENPLFKAAKDNVSSQEYNVMAIHCSDVHENRFQVQLETFQEYCINPDGNAWIRSLTYTLRILKVQSYLREFF